MIIQLLVDGGDMKPGPAIAQKLGPLGINIGKVVADVNAASKNFKGVKVPVELNINKDKTYTIVVLSPPTTELLKKEIGLEKASGAAKKIKVANASIEQIISVAKTKYPNMLCKDFKAAVKTVAGSCVSSGILIENKEAKETVEDIEKGIYDKEIDAQMTETSAEKKKKLDAHFADVKAQQEARIKKETEEKEAAEAKKAEAVAAAGAAAVPGAAAGKEVAAAGGKEGAAKTAEKAPAGKEAAKPAAGAKAEKKPAKK
jgi:large subunit ribosomal protein L11